MEYRAIKHGLIHVYTGNGKGKTTTALGMALRAIGHKKKVYFIQLLKGGAYTGEIIASKNISKLNITQFGEPCYYLKEMEAMDCRECMECFDTKKDGIHVNRGMKAARKALKSGKYDMVILDEINNALHKHYLTVKEVINLLKKKSEQTEVVLTGRHAPKEIIKIADLVTEMKEIKHPYNEGIKARAGIEY
ncbi:MAG: cob(I)yrinic acid a,c-diamide adenosyltransferase [archaeon]